MNTNSINRNLRKVFTIDNINPHLKRAQYAVRGELAIRAEELKEDLRKNPNSLPFKKVIFCNIGNPQQLKQRPLTYFRQIMSLLEWPELIESETMKLYPSDVVKRARNILKSVGSIGAYSHSQGIPLIRESVARFIHSRDGVPCDAKSIFLTNGASDAVTRILECIITSSDIGIMIPIPQYPLYTAVITLLNGTSVPYYLDESNGWSLNVGELERSIDAARRNGVKVRALCIINPGNPTGGCFSESTLKEIVSFCQKQELVLLADEVYQQNTYVNKGFISARKVASQMNSNVEVISFHSISKGLIGECGHRGGYYECYNIESDVLDLLYKQSSICLCANVPGQIMVGLMTNPPVPGDESHELYVKEIKEIHESLGRRAVNMQKALSSMTDVYCNEAEGAMYLFPKFNFPVKLIEHSRLLSKQPDEVYAMALLNATGICVVPGSGFGQLPGTFHIRTTFLPAEEDFDDFIQLWMDFHENYINKWK